jgi:hypothetical protein
MSERSELITWIRGEIVGPSPFLKQPLVAEFTNGEFVDTEPKRRGPVAWRPAPDADLEEILYYDRETPHRKYGAGLLHPGGVMATRSGTRPRGGLGRRC